MGCTWTHLAGRLAALALIAASETGLAASGSDDRWSFTLEPYLWLPNANLSVDTTVTGLPGPSGGKTRSVDVSAETDPGNYLSNLNMAVMLIGEARKGDWSLFTDIIYVDFGDQDSRVRGVADPGGGLSADGVRHVDIDLSTTVWTLAGGYRVAKSSAANLDLFAGFRYLVMDSSLALTVQDGNGRLVRSKSASMNEQAWDGIVGARGRLSLNDRWFMPYYADIGAGDSNWTWQAMLGLGYKFSWGDTILAVRSLSYSFDDNDVDLRMTGPALGVAFKW
ncbi:MAG: hypothetical protein WBG92_05015 [Thiohalocapsa sp.]